MCNCQQCQFDISYLLEGKCANDLIEILHKVQDKYGYIPKDCLIQISKALGIEPSKIYGVITFYSRFSLKPKGKYIISVCMGTACYVKGAEALLDELSEMLNVKVGDTTDDLIFSLVETRCVGDCASAPIVTVNDKVYKKVTKNDLRDILSNIKEA